MKVKVREFTLQDIEEIYKEGVLAREFWVGEETSFYGRDYLIAWIANKRDDILLVAEKGKKIAGFLFCRVMFRTWAMGENIYVIKDESESGIEKVLFDECKRRLKDLGIDYIAWLVRPGTPEEEFVKKMGFEKGNQFFWWEKKTRPLWPDHRAIKEK